MTDPTTPSTPQADSDGHRVVSIRGRLPHRAVQGGRQLVVSSAIIIVLAPTTIALLATAMVSFALIAPALLDGRHAWFALGRGVILWWGFANLGFAALAYFIGTTTLTLGVALSPLLARASISLARLLPAVDRRKPILYLRSFASDQPSGRLSLSFPAVADFGRLLVGGLARWGPTSDRELWNYAPSEEERLVDDLSRLGPVVAVGSPGELVPPLGARRVYLSSVAWEAEVERIMRTSALVVLRPGNSVGVRREVSLVSQAADPTKFVIVVPRDALRDYGLLRYTSIRLLPFELPEINNAPSIVAFDAQWRPTVKSDWGSIGCPLTRPAWWAGHTRRLPIAVCIVVAAVAAYHATPAAWDLLRPLWLKTELFEETPMPDLDGPVGNPGVR